MIPAFVIHHPSTKEREEIVADLVAKTNAIVVEAILCSNGAEGCTKSHLKVASLAKELYPDSSYFVFEDDCILGEEWKTIGNVRGDLVYLGYTDKCEHTIFGTHGMRISPKARDAFLQVAMEIGQALPPPHTLATDWIWTRVAQRFRLQVCMPVYEKRQAFCHQKKGLRSIITGKIR